MRTIAVILLQVLPFCLFAQSGERTYQPNVPHKKEQTVEVQNDSVVCYTGLPYLDERKIFQDIYVKGQHVKVRSVQVICYDITDRNDSVKVYSLKTDGFRVSDKKLYASPLSLNGYRPDTDFNPLYKNILTRNERLPAGDYHTYLTLALEDRTITRSYIHHVDSVLSVNSGANKKFNEIFTSEKKNGLSKKLFKQAEGYKRNVQPSVTLQRSSAKIDREFSKEGFVVNYREVSDAQKHADVYYDERYIGYYVIDMDEPLEDKIKQKQNRLRNNLASGVNNNLDNNKPVFEQMRELYQSDEDREVKGNISFTTNVATGQEEYSENENNYYEVTGQVEVPVMGIPIEVGAYYTSQDKGRVAKASYFRMHYDSEQAKAKLSNLIGQYSSKYDQASSRVGSYDMVYGTYINNIESEKDKLLADIVSEAGISSPAKFKLDTTGLFNEMTVAGERKLRDSLSQKGEGLDLKQIETELNANKQRVVQQYEAVMQKYEQIKELEEKVEHYKHMLEQYSQNNFYDSVMAYERLKDIKDKPLDETSYKSLSKSAGSLLPEGDSKKFISGLTSLDLGIFSKQVSAYTLNGQTIKGIDAGYDFGFCETEFTYGRIEYVSRDGLLDKYNGYSGRVNFIPADNHKTSLIYYGYMPGKKSLIRDSFYRDIDITMPDFRNPMNIVSLMHTGSITKYVDLNAEVATSFRNLDEIQQDTSSFNGRMSYRMDVMSRIPGTTLDVNGGYEHVGKRFENNTLPLNLSGTDRYRAEATGQFFKSFLMLGVEYNYLVQQNFAGKSGNSKWGFQVKTTSKRYPSVSVSYKPFSTFRSFADTLNIPQRPIIGEVWLGKVSYQHKWKYATLRIAGIYNKNTSSIDTMESGSDIKQLNVLYTKGKLNLMLNAGQANVKSTSLLSPVHGKNDFMTLMAAYSLNSHLNVSVGQDIAKNELGLSRYGANVGAGYRFRNLPLSVRSGFRYNTYRLRESTGWKSIYSGMIDINWKFRFKMKDQ